jgi:DUF4097 and DUF4098 domain-containing protein YvlB
MATFVTPEPIAVALEIGVGHVSVVATERADTVVEVSPTDPASKSDIAAAAETRVELIDGVLSIRTAKRWRQYTPWSGSESIEVQVGLPSGSHIRATAGVGTFTGSGRLGECHLKTGVGDIQLDEVGSVEIKTGAGAVTVERIVGDAVITTGSGALRLASIDGTAVMKNMNGDTWIGQVTGPLKVNAGNGGISVGQADDTVTARTANGDIRLGQVVRGVVVAQTACGKVEVGVRDGVAAWLDLDTHFGNVDNRLDAGSGPAPGETAVEVRARNSFGDIAIHRS